MINPQTGKDEKYFAIEHTNKEKPMGRWNFDFIFNGALDERGKKANAFLQGVDLLREDIQVQFAMAHLTGEDSEKLWTNLEDLQKMEVSFYEDPRTKAVLMEKTAEQFGQVGASVIDKLFERLGRAVRAESEERR